MKAPGREDERTDRREEGLASTEVDFQLLELRVFQRGLGVEQQLWE